MCARLIRFKTEQLRAFTPETNSWTILATRRGHQSSVCPCVCDAPLRKIISQPASGPESKLQKTSSENVMTFASVDRYWYTAHSISPRLAAPSFFYPLMYIRRPLLAVYHVYLLEPSEAVPSFVSTLHRAQLAP